MWAAHSVNVCVLYVFNVQQLTDLKQQAPQQASAQVIHHYVQPGRLQVSHGQPRQQTQGQSWSILKEIKYKKQNSVQQPDDWIHWIQRNTHGTCTNISQDQDISCTLLSMLPLLKLHSSPLSTQYIFYFWIIYLSNVVQLVVFFKWT